MCFQSDGRLARSREVQGHEAREQNQQRHHPGIAAHRKDLPQVDGPVGQPGREKRLESSTLPLTRKTVGDVRTHEEQGNHQSEHGGHAARPPHLGLREREEESEDPDE